MAHKHTYINNISVNISQTNESVAIDETSDEQTTFNPASFYGGNRTQGHVIHNVSESPTMPVIDLSDEATLIIDDPVDSKSSDINKEPNSPHIVTKKRDRTKNTCYFVDGDTDDSDYDQDSDEDYDPKKYTRSPKKNKKIKKKKKLH